MNLALAIVYFVAALGLALAGATRVGAWLVERRNPPVGEFATVAGTRMHYVHIPAPAGAGICT